MLKRGVGAADIPAWAASYVDLPPAHWAYAQIIEASVEHTFSMSGGREIWDAR
jgi:hypothetical protein